MTRPAAALAMALLVGAPGCGGREPAAGRPPDVLLVVLDTLRADHSSTYGYARPTTPQLDSLAVAGVVFADVTASAPWTWPSHASLFTGEPPWVHGARLRGDPAGEATASRTAARFGIAVDPMRGDLATLAERFAAGGYRTVALVVNDWLHPALGLLRGFERAELLPSDAALVEAAAEAMGDPDPRPLFLFLNAMTAHSPFREGPGPWALDDPAFLDPLRAPGWLRPYLTADRPRGVHLPGVAPGDEASGVVLHAAGRLAIPEGDRRKLVALYDAGVRGADFVLGRVLVSWTLAHPSGVVAVTSDHGEGFGEHGMLDHRSSVYPEALHVPMVLAAPGRLPAGARVSAPLELRDLHPTLLELAGLGARPRSWVELARGTAAPPDDPVTATAWPDPGWALHAGGRFGRRWRLFREGDWALVSAAGEPEATELYHVSSDPGMRSDLAAEEPARAASLLAASRRHFAAERDSVGTPLEIPEALAERLRRLGYAD